VGDRPWLAGAAKHFEVSGTPCDGHPVCALVMAIYEPAPWLT
jgi:hypothetical protein